MGQLRGIAVRDAEGGPMRTIERSVVTCEAGLDEDFYGPPGPRQVTVISSELWAEACQDLGADVHWTKRRANLLLEGIALESTMGSRLRVGPVVLEIRGPCPPCGVMTQQRKGLKEALQPGWRAGAVCKVIEGGEINVGDEVTLEPQNESAPAASQ